jgi:hypothetical protein
MIWIPFKHENEVTLRCALHSRGIDPKTIDADVALCELLEILTEEIRRNNPRPTKCEPLPGQLSLLGD